MKRYLIRALVFTLLTASGAASADPGSIANMSTITTDSLAFTSFADSATEGTVTLRAEFEAASPTAPRAVYAQAFDVEQGQDNVAHQTVIRRVKAGQKVRVTTDSIQLQLRWVGASPNGVSGVISEKELGSTQAEATSDTASVQWSEIRRLDVRGRAAGTGVPIGLVVGALGGVATGVALSQMTFSTASQNEVVSAALLCGVVGAFGGAIIGAMIGSAFPKWHKIYKSSEGAVGDGRARNR
jgi:hypothetical protein